MKNLNFTRLTTFLFAVLSIGIYGCEEHLGRYDDPPWLGGTTIETLEKRGNYTIFLKLMEKANYKEPITKQLFTVFVPNDAAFTAYFKQNGIDSVGALTKKEATQLFTLHVLRNARSSFQLIYEYVWSELQGPNGEYAGLFFRKPVLSTTTPYYDSVRYFPAYKGKRLLIYNDSKYVPLFTKDYFEDFFGDPDGSDYEFLYPGHKWDGKMHWHSSMVTEPETRTASGFIYFIDSVVPIMPTIEEYLLKNQKKYGLFYGLAQRFATYGASKVDPTTNLLQYKKGYNLILNITEEQGPFPGNETRMKDMFSAYIPSDAVLQNYLDNTVLKYYPALDSVPDITIFYILQTHLARSLGLVSKITKSYFNSFGDPMDIAKSDIKDAYMCSNGVVYEMNRVLEPNVFTTVPGPIFFNSNYSTFLFALNAANMLSSLSSTDVNVTLFVPTNEQFEKYGVRYNPIKAGIEIRGKDKVWKTIRTDDLAMIVQDHIYAGKLTDLSGDGYVKMASGNWIHYNNNQIEGPENQVFKNMVGIVGYKENEKNGMLYYIDDPIQSSYVMGKYLVRTPELSEFTKLLTSTRMLDARFIDPLTRDTVPNLKFLAESDQWTAFIPDDAAMAKAKEEGLIPTDPAELKNFLLYHFVRRNAIFDDGKLSGSFPTSLVESVTSSGTTYVPLMITNQVNNLVVTDGFGQTVAVDHARANNLTRKGVVHRIDKVLRYK